MRWQVAFEFGLIHDWSPFCLSSPCISLLIQRPFSNYFAFKVGALIHTLQLWAALHFLDMNTGYLVAARVSLSPLVSVVNIFFNSSNGTAYVCLFTWVIFFTVAVVSVTLCTLNISHTHTVSILTHLSFTVLSVYCTHTTTAWLEQLIGFEAEKNVPHSYCSNRWCLLCSCHSAFSVNGWKRWAGLQGSSRAL